MQAEEVLEPFARDFRQFWNVVSNNEATVEMVDACLKGAYALGITQPQFRPWLPLSKIGETVAILHIMRCNLCLERGDLARAVHDAQAAVVLSTVPGSSQCAPKATSSMWFAQACRALGRACVVRPAPCVSWPRGGAVCCGHKCVFAQSRDHRPWSHVPRVAPVLSIARF